MKRGFACVASTRDRQHASCLTVQPSHTSAHANTQASSHVSVSAVFLSVSNGTLPSPLGLMLTFALSSVIEKSYMSKEDQQNSFLKEPDSLCRIF